MTECEMSDLCRELAGARDTEFHQTYQGDPPSRRLIDTGHFAVLADLSPLKDGHVLVLPKRHYLNMGQAIADYRDEFRALLDLFVPVYIEAYREPAFLEHGSSTDMEASACINHAHLHVLPIDAQAVGQRMRNDGLAEERIASIDALADRPDQDASYFLCGSLGSISIFGVGERREKQYLRSVASQEIGLPPGTWDWAAYIRKDTCRATVARLSKLLGLI